MFLLVKWKAYPEKFNSWVNEKDIKNLSKEYQSSSKPLVIFSAIKIDQTQAFYLTLPSNSSVEIYPTNLDKFYYTTSKFSLPRWRLGSRTYRNSVSIHME